MRILLSFLLLFCIHSITAQNEIDSLFRDLDNKIKNSTLYVELKEAKIDELKTERIRNIASVNKTYSSNFAIYNEYKSYISDSAIKYLNYNMDISYSLNDQQKLNETSITMSELFAGLGMYKEAIDVIVNIKKIYLDKPQLIEYYSNYRQIYSGLGMYTQNSRDRWRYWQRSNEYRDSILNLANKNSEISLRLNEGILREKGKIDEALELNNKRLQYIKKGTPGYALITFHRSLLYRKKGDQDQEKKYLILSALSDIQSSIKDNASISMLADILMKEGDINRAYTYVRFSLDNINDYNTRIRSSEILNIQSIIDKAYQTKSNEQRESLRILLIIATVLLILLIISVCYVYKQMKKGELISKRLKETNTELNTLNQKLHNMNNNLKNVNVEVTEANYIKEEYIGYFLDQCSKYIDKMDEYRKMVNKKIQNKEIENLFKVTKNNDLKEEELREFFNNFDNMFIHLYPDFVDKFNALLQNDEKIVLKKGEVLNTELRIYALMRLGIDDSTKIANFLGYSVNTIYNYRAKIKNKSKISREDFEWTVKKIGTFNG